MGNGKRWIGTIHEGQGLVEYALLIVLVVIAVLLILAMLGVNLSETYCDITIAFGGSGTCRDYCSDDFDSLSNWTNRNNTGWIENNGMLCNSGAGEQRTFDRCSNNQNTPIPDDYVVNVDVANLLSGNGYGIYFRLQSTNPTNGYVFQYDPGYPGFIFRRWVNGYELAPFARSRPTNYTWLNQPRNVRIVVNGNQFQAYVDDVMVLSGTDSTFPSGGTGFRTWDSTQACFDGYSVEAIP